MWLCTRFISAPPFFHSETRSKMTFRLLATWRVLPLLLLFGPRPATRLRLSLRPGQLCVCTLPQLVGFALPVLKLLPHNAIALAGGFFQAWSVQNRDMAARVFDQAGSLQNTGGNR